MLSSKEFCSISNGAACNSKSYNTSYVLLAMGIPEDQIESSVRISWGYDTEMVEFEKSFKNLLESAKKTGLVKNRNIFKRDAIESPRYIYDS